MFDIPFNYIADQLNACHSIEWDAMCKSCKMQTIYGSSTCFRWLKFESQIAHHVSVWMAMMRSSLLCPIVHWFLYFARCNFAAAVDLYAAQYHCADDLMLDLLRICKLKIRNCVKWTFGRRTLVFGSVSIFTLHNSSEWFRSHKCWSLVSDRQAPPN